MTIYSVCVRPLLLPVELEPNIVYRGRKNIANQIIHSWRKQKPKVMMVSFTTGHCAHNRHIVSDGDLLETKYNKMCCNEVTQHIFERVSRNSIILINVSIHTRALSQLGLCLCYFKDMSSKNRNLK